MTVRICGNSSERWAGKQGGHQPRRIHRRTGQGTVFCGSNPVLLTAPDLVDEVIDKLSRELYKHFVSTKRATRRRFTVVVRIYVIGAQPGAAWGLGRQSTTLRPVPSGLYDPDYISVVDLECDGVRCSRKPAYGIR